MKLFGRDDAPDDDAVRAARIRAARRNAAWEELLAIDLVERGDLLVSAEDDRCFRRHPGVVFQTGSAAMVANMAKLFFFVDDAGEISFLEDTGKTWSGIVTKQARRQARA